MVRNFWIFYLFILLKVCSIVVRQIVGSLSNYRGPQLSLCYRYPPPTLRKEKIVVEFDTREVVDLINNCSSNFIDAFDEIGKNDF